MYIVTMSEPPSHQLTYSLIYTAARGAFERQSPELQVKRANHPANAMSPEAGSQGTRVHGDLVNADG